MVEDDSEVNSNYEANRNIGSKALIKFQENQKKQRLIDQCKESRKERMETLTELRQKRKQRRDNIICCVVIVILVLSIVGLIIYNKLFSS